MKKFLALLLAVMLSLTCFVACKGKDNDEKPADTSSPTKVVYDVDDAAAYLKNMYKKYLTETETAADYTLVSQVMKSGVIYTITWTTDRDDIKVIEDKENKQVTIDLDEKTPVDIEYTLTATIADPDGKTATLSFKLKVPKYVLSSWDQYMKLDAGKAVVIEGYVAAIHSQSEGNKYNMLYVHDVNNKGGYYIYSMTADPIKDLNLKKGMLVSVTGTKDIYSGTHEIKDASVNVLDTKVVDFAPLDITSIFKKADSCSDASLVSKLGMLVTIKGVEITDQNTSEKSQYYNFNLDGLTSYIRLYRTDCPCTVSDADMKAIAEQHTAKFGYSADVTGVVVMYGGSIYLNPVDKNCFKYGAKIVRDDAAKVKYEIDNISEFGINTDIKANTQVINLPTKGNRYEDVAISWAVSEDSKGALQLEGSKLTVTLQDAATTAKIKGTFTCNGKTGTVELTLKLAAKQTLVPVADKTPVPGKDYLLFFFQEKNGNYDYFTGEMNGFYGASSLNHEQAVKVRVENVTGGSLLYFTDKDGAKQYITIEESGTHVNFVFKTDKPTTPFTFDANGAPMFKLNDTKSYYIGTYGTYYTFGTQDTTQSGSYIAYLGTMVDTTKVSDADKVATEKNNVKPEVEEVFANADVKLPIAGTTYPEVAITWASDKDFAVVDNAKGIVSITLQDEAQTVKLTATLKCGTATDTKEFTIAVASKNAAPTTPTEIVEAAYALEAGATLAGGPYTLTGIIKTVDTAYSSQYNNVTVTIIVENLGDKPIQCFRLKGTGADVIAVGDTITVTGDIKNYNGTIEFNAGCTLDSYKTDDETVNALYALNSGESLEGKYALTGVIKSVDTPYSEQYKNITVTIDVLGVEGKPVQCFRLTGDKAADLKVGDTITVYGTLKRYNNTFEFDKNCEIIAYTAAPEESGGGAGGGAGGSDIVPGALAATFTMGEDDSSKTNETNQDGTEITEYAEENNGYTLTLTNLSKVYGGSFDAVGNACIKLGTSSVVGSFTFVVPENIKSVKIYVTGYKAKTSKVTINGGDAVTLTKSSANGEYDVITVDTSTNKTVTFATASGATRVKLSTIEFYN